MTWHYRPDWDGRPPLCNWWTDGEQGIDRCTKWTGHDGEHEHGDVGLLDATWDRYGGKPSDPAQQARIGLRYIRDRYGVN